MDSGLALRAPRNDGELFRSLHRRLLRGRLRRAEVMRGVDQSDVRHSQREVSVLASRAGILFLGEQAEIVGNRGHAGKQLFRAVDLARQHIGIGEP